MSALSREALAERIARIIQSYEGDPEHWSNFRDAANAIISEVIDEPVPAATVPVNSRERTCAPLSKPREKNRDSALVVLDFPGYDSSNGRRYPADRNVVQETKEVRYAR